jgi:hypothetical protein
VQVRRRQSKLLRVRRKERGEQATAAGAPTASCDPIRSEARPAMNARVATIHAGTLCAAASLSSRANSCTRRRCHGVPCMAWQARRDRERHAETNKTIGPDTTERPYPFAWRTLASGQSLHACRVLLFVRVFADPCTGSSFGVGCRGSW